MAYGNCISGTGTFSNLYAVKGNHLNSITENYLGVIYETTTSKTATTY